MNVFGSKPQEQAMQRLVHETNRISSELGQLIKQLEEWNRENTKILQANNLETPSKPFYIIEYLKSRRKQLMDSMDEYVTKFKNDFPEQP